MTLRHKNLQMDQRIDSIHRVLKNKFFCTFKNSIFANLGKKYLTVYKFSISKFSHPILLLGQFRDYYKKISSLTSFACPIAHF
jgi:hypothetical protein